MLISNHQSFIENLPFDWERVQIKDLGFICAGGTPNRENKHYWNGNIPWVTPSELTGLHSKYLDTTKECLTAKGIEDSAAKLLPANSLLITTRATIGAVAISRTQICTNQGFKNIVPNEKTSPDFYYHLFKFIGSEMQRLSSGSTFQEINQKTFESIIVPRPAVDEQIAIARILDTIDEAIQKTEQLIAKLKAIKQGLLHDLLTRGLDENGQLRDPIAHPEQFKDSPLGKIPKDWEYGPLKQFVDFMPGYGFSLELQGEIEGDFSFFKVSDMEISENSRYMIKANNYVNEKLVLKKGWKPVPPGSVVFAKVGGALLLNRRRITISPSLIDNNMMAVITKGEIIVNFLYWWMTRLDFAQLVQTTALPSVNQTQLGRVLIAFPIKQEDQIQIVSFLDSTDMLIEKELAFLKKLQSLKKGLMQDLLTGKVRVNITAENLNQVKEGDSP